METVSLKDIWLKYSIDFRKNGKVVPEEFWALKGINLEINKGEVIGLIGENGAGKTTVLKIIAGMLIPDKGKAKINGTVSTLMEIGSGLHRDLTGKENIYLMSSFFGFNKSQVDERYEDIIRFAELGKFIDAPVKIYSQGMYMRLAFSIAIHIKPDILLLDDMFVVGDIAAQKKCIKKIFELRDRGVTIIFALQDLEMLKRICSRGLFLREGMVVKDGPIAAICDYYEETVGNREGIAIAQKGPLGVVFNNGKLILRWENKAITCNFGGQCSMQVGKREYLSSTAEWRVQNPQTDGEIAGVGTWSDIPVTQHWKVRLLNEREFLWEITVQTREGSAIEKIDIRNAFVGDYNKWFNLEEERDFPEVFIHGMPGDCVRVGDAYNKVVGVKSSAAANQFFPTVIFETLHSDGKTICQVGNTAAEARGRVMQHQVFFSNADDGRPGSKQRFFSHKVLIFDAGEESGVQAHIEEARQIVRESTVIRNGPLSLCCRNNKIEIYWLDKLLSREAGFNTKFKCQEKEYGSSTGHWTIQKKSPEEITINITWDDDNSFFQVWKFSLPSEDVMFWTVEMYCAEKIRLRNKQAELILSEEYERWATPGEEGGIERLEKKGHNVVLRKYVNNHFGVKAVFKDKDIYLPEVTFANHDAAPFACFISRNKENGLCTVLRYLGVDLPKTFYTSPGMDIYFKGTIHVTDPYRQPSQIKNDTGVSCRMDFSRLSVLFDHGKGRIFWKNTELTRGLGMYTSVFFNGVSYDSSQASWEIVQTGENSLKAIGHWCWIPMAQTWEIVLLNEKTVAWKIERMRWENFTSEKEQVNLMLSDGYGEWFVPKQLSERFPGKFRKHGGTFWDRLWCREGAVPMGVRKNKSVPPLIFDCQADCQTRYSAIENTDDLFQARVIQYELYPEQEEYSGGGKYFDGQVTIIA